MNTATNSIWRLHIKTAAQENVDPFEFCIKEKILGLGWPVSTSNENESLDWDSYYQLAKNRYGEDRSWWPAVNAIRNRMKRNDLCWSRDSGDSKANYYLGRVLSDWSYKATREHKDADVVNIRECDWKKIERGLVPGVIESAFGRGKTLQQIRQEKEYSKFLWNEVTGENFYSVAEEGLDIFEMLNYEETEDLLFLYLQEKGWYVVPNSRKGNTLKYEFSVVNPKTGEQGATQVKTGTGTSLNAEEYDEDGQVFLFQSEENYRGKTPKNVVLVRRKELLSFLENSTKWLPEWLRNKMEMVQENRQ